MGLFLRRRRTRAAMLAATLLAGCARAGPPAGPPAPDIGWEPGPSFPRAFAPRWDAAVASFPPAGQVVLFGGAPRLPTEDWRNDTWILADGRWAPGPPAPRGLTPRGGAAMAYFPPLGKLVLFGGGDGAWPPAMSDTWLFDGASWTQGPPAPPGLAPREGAGLAFDPRLGKLVLLGGSGAQGYRDTWLFDGTEWIPGPAPPEGMPARSHFGMAYDPRIGRVVAAGGSGAADVWSFDGSGWAREPSLPPAAPRERFHMAYDPALGGLVSFAGVGPGAASNALWLLRGGRWAQLAPAASSPVPQPRLDAFVLWDPRRKALVAFGGFADLRRGDVPLRDGWYAR